MKLSVRNKETQERDIEIEFYLEESFCDSIVLKAKNVHTQESTNVLKIREGGYDNLLRIIRYTSVNSPFNGKDIFATSDGSRVRID